MVERLGLNAAWYHDLEQNDDELASTLTLFQALDLASLLGVSLDELFPGSRASATRIALVELPARIEKHAAQKGISVAQLEGQVDWPLQAFMTGPLQMAAELPIAFFQSLAAALGIDWLSLIPEAQD